MREDRRELGPDSGFRVRVSVTLEADIFDDTKSRSCGGRIGGHCNVCVAFEFDDKNLLGKIGAGDEARTRNFQLGNLNFRSFIFNTYKIA